MKEATSQRRRLIVIILLSFAVAGAVIRLFAPKPSLARDIGTLLLVMWVPAVGNIIGYLIKNYGPKFTPKPAFVPGRFVPHALIDLSVPAPTFMSVNEAGVGEYRFAVVLGTEGFTARVFVPGSAERPSIDAQRIELEFLAPAVALPRFAADTPFQVLADDKVIGQGRIVKLLTSDAGVVSNSPTAPAQPTR